MVALRPFLEAALTCMGPQTARRDEKQSSGLWDFVAPSGGGSGEWKGEPLRWKHVFVDFYRDMVGVASDLNDPSPPSSRLKTSSETRSQQQQQQCKQRRRVRWEGEGLDAVDDVGEGGARARARASEVPVLVMTLPGRADRRKHSERLLSSLGFTNVSFPPILLAADIQPDALQRNGTVSAASVARLSRMGAGAMRNALAHALSMMQALASHVQDQTELLIVLEDDLMPTSALGEVRRRILEAVAQLPVREGMDDASPGRTWGVLLRLCAIWEEEGGLGEKGGGLLRLSCKSIERWIV